MLRKTIVVVFVLFAYTRFCYAEVTLVQRSDGTIVKITTTRITNSVNQVPSYEGNQQDEAVNYSTRSGNGQVIYVYPNIGYAPHTGHGSHIGYPPHNGHDSNTDSTPNIDYDSNTGDAPNIGQ